MRTPTTKVSIGAAAGAMTVVLVWLVSTVWGKTVPPEVAASLTVVIQSLAGYFMPEDNGYDDTYRKWKDR